MAELEVLLLLSTSNYKEERKAEKREVLRTISQRFLPSHTDAFDAAVERSMSRTTVVRITLTEPPVGKRKPANAPSKNRRRCLYLRYQARQ